MRWAGRALAGLWLACLLGTDPGSAWADDGGVPPRPPPPEWHGRTAPEPAPAPRPRAPDAQLVPVPDVRGLSQAGATRALRAAGLRVGEVERVAADVLERELGRRYPPGIVVQQAPRPSAGETPSWLARGTLVHLRMSAGVAAPEPAPPTPPVQVPLPIPVPVPQPPVVPPLPTPAPAGPGLATPPPPPAWDGGVTPDLPPSTPPALPGPATVPYVPPATQPLDSGGPEAWDTELLGGRVPSRTRLACERGRGGGHFRARGGYAWWFGADHGSAGAYAGGDLGYTFGDCWGVDVFYRYASTRFPRAVGGVTLQDGGDVHFLGAKATYESAVSRSSDWFFWAGLGFGWVKTNRFLADDSGFGILGEAGVGYLVSNSVRLRLGVDINALFTSAGRRLPANDSANRWLTSVAPTLGVEFDF